MIFTVVALVANTVDILKQFMISLNLSEKVEKLYRCIGKVESRSRKLNGNITKSSFENKNKCLSINLELWKVTLK